MKKIMKNNVACGVCKATDVKVYRPIGHGYNESYNRCNECLHVHPPETYKDPYGSYVPCIPTDDGEIWSTHCVSSEDLRWWYSLPEKNPKNPIWDSFHDMWSHLLKKETLEEIRKRITQGAQNMDESQDVKPISPDEVVSLKETLIPDFVINIFNKKIAQNWNGYQAKVFLVDVIDAVVAMNDSNRTRMYREHWFDVEDIYREAGWDVEFCQLISAKHYIFKKKS